MRDFLSLKSIRTVIVVAQAKHNHILLVKVMISKKSNFQMSVIADERGKP